VGVVHLNLEAFVGPADGLKDGVEIDARIGPRFRQDVGLQFEILPIMVMDRPHVKEVGALAVNDDFTVLHRKGPGIVARLPVIERFAVEQGSPAIGRIGRESRASPGREEE
jgi:hypothetical protein